MNTSYNINYNTDMICTYRDFSNNYYSNLCYQIQLLQIFNMSKYDEYMLTKNIESVYNILKDDEMILKSLQVFESKYNEISLMSGIIGDKQLLFQLLFSYDFFDIFHKSFRLFLKEWRENNNKNSQHFSLLCQYILDKKD